MSSRNVLRAAVLYEEPQLIDNEFVGGYIIPSEPPAMVMDDDLVEALQFEHPDAEPDEIQDALQEVMDQLRDAPQPDFQLGEEEEPEAGSDDSFSFDFDAPAAELTEEQDAELDLDTPLDLDAAAPAVPTFEAPDPGPILEAARLEAQRILAEADDRAAEIQKAAYDKGHAEGFEAGKAEGEAKGVELVRQAVAIVDQATELHDTMLREAEGEMVVLCLEVARKVIHTEVASNPHVVHEVLAQAVQRINGSPRVTIKVHPDQVEDVRMHWDAAFGPGYREKEWLIEGDASVDLGGCVLDTRYGSIDARIGTQFSQIQKTFELLLGADE